MDWAHKGEGPWRLEVERRYSYGFPELGSTLYGTDRHSAGEVRRGAATDLLLISTLVQFFVFV